MDTTFVWALALPTFSCSTLGQVHVCCSQEHPRDQTCVAIAVVPVLLLSSHSYNPATLPC